MNILIISTAYPLRGGIAHYNHLLSLHLAKRHTVDIITFKRQYPKLLFPGTTQDEGDTEFAVRRAPQLVDSINPLNWIAVAREVRRRNPDVIIFKYWLPFFGPCFGTIAKLAKRRTRAKVLYICDNIIPHERRPGDILFTRYAFAQGDYFIVQSDTVERDLVHYFPRAVYRKVAHPVYEMFGEPLSKEDARKQLGIDSPRVILYFGYVRPYKGLLVLIDAMKRLTDAGRTDILLLAVGEFYDDVAGYSARIRELGLASNVRLVPEYVANEQVRTYFSAADAVILPYRSATQSGIAQIAYNFDRPIIATDVGELPQVVLHDRTGYIVPPNDPDALAAAILRFYDEKKEGVFRENILQEKKKYSWDAVVAAIEELSGVQ